MSGTSPPPDWDARDAPNVPALIEQLSSTDTDARLRAPAVLHDLLAHQGTLEPAASAAAPLLVELACSPQVPDRHWILILLADLTAGLPGRMHAGFGPEPGEAVSPRGDARCVQAIADVVAARASRLATSFEDPEPRVRTAAGLLLAFFPPVADEVSAAASSRLERETDARARASELLCQGRCARTARRREGASHLAAALNSPELLVRAAAGVALAYVDESGLGTPAFEALAEAASSLPRETAEVLRVNETSGLFPWAGGDMGALAANVLGWLGEHGVREASRVLRKALDARLDAGDVPVAPPMPDLATLQAMLARGAQGSLAPEPSPLMAADEVPRGSTVRAIVRALVPLVLGPPSSAPRAEELTPVQRELVEHLARRLPDMGPFVRE